MNRVGKIGKRNLDANKVLKTIFLEKGITWCEICSSTSMLSFAHKHPREYYRSDPDGLSRFDEVLLLCIPHHQELDDRSLTSQEESDALFDKLRG
jgi:hypothetical protein